MDKMYRHTQFTCTENAIATQVAETYTYKSINDVVNTRCNNT